ncbi:hypothetical protein [Lentzea cavernae]|uniref:Uncharacterized protein n=1 Tax=Lentzea cavernae TaxID=2020703 RepID=A0ABQ3MS75_9PSEU|nr:hypothetical protein [Lentzea cavernae]GHH57515.1 hypothetical protein GCM10017774_77140 [Lentzea cavernae]
MYVDLANKSCVITDGTTQHGAWAPGITRTNVEDHIANAGWMFADGSEWRMTIDGGVREVVQADELLLDDLFLDIVGSAAPEVRKDFANDDLCARLLAARNKSEVSLTREIGRTPCAMTVIAMARAA